MSIRMFHPENGYHVLSYGEVESDFLENGWIREDEISNEEPHEVKESAKSRRGRPPKEKSNAAE